MRTLQEWLDIEIETKKLKELNHSSQYPSKISGSGGGDCGIIFLPLNHTPDYLENWKENDITLIEGGMIHEYTIKT